VIHTEDKGPCGDCGHSFDSHAPDVSFPNVQRCFHGAATGDGCRYEYSERCKNYVPPQKG
jgi:hypothetical protein